MSTIIYCSECLKEYSFIEMPLTCECGGILSIKRNANLDAGKFLNREIWSMFRYKNFLPLDCLGDAWKGITLGEGMTPVVDYGSDFGNLKIKMDYMMPTLSFKDRGASILVAAAKKLGIKEIVQDSSGNAGIAVAAYAARAGIKCSIFVPAGNSKKKIQQIYVHGADVYEIEGTREDTAKAALNKVLEEKLYYASHVYNPFFYEGTKTYVFELFEQLKGNMPDYLWVPVGNGTLLLGCYYGLLDLKSAGLISKFPKMIAVQSHNCAPVHDAFYAGEDVVKPCVNKGTLAEGIAIADPKRGKLILQALRELDGEVLTADEKAICAAAKKLAGDGFYFETTTAATFAAYFSNPDFQDKISVLPACGAGIKSSII
ncbi:MAG: pyridoxal-phosphate dependent enzyme [Lentisphaerae bacterium]|nr:pyridoxal-phosphate dependent enzyme [Lentisphaerota bacterium]MCP4099942.1 pyridoxal-phosphate dependent enzyme [Lentisphaerota bacterium]